MSDEQQIESAEAPGQANCAVGDGSASEAVANRIAANLPIKWEDAAALLHENQVLRVECAKLALEIDALRTALSAYVNADEWTKQLEDKAGAALAYAANQVTSLPNIASQTTASQRADLKTSP